MTVTYTHKSHTAGCIGGLTRLLFIWKGSLIKQILPEMILYFSLYFALSLMYRYVLMHDEDAKVTWELFCVYCEKFSKVIPTTFLLGFYVTQVVSRWWAQFMSIPWPDTLARYLVVYLPGKDKRSREVRRTIIRWVNLGNILALRLVSYKVMLRFPTYEHLIESGLCTNKEIIMIKKLEDTFNHRHQISWYPSMWAQSLLRTARKEGLIANDWFTHVMIKEIDTMANSNGMLICYAWISIPLVYTQVVTLAVYSYFIACMFGRQYLLPTQYKAEGSRYVAVSEFPTVANWTQTAYAGASNIVGYDNSLADFIVPCFSILEYFFYMGWLKVAETLLNPFGEDDDDFDTYYLIDRNIQVSLVMAEEAGRHFDLEPDPFNDGCPAELKHTVISAQYLDDYSPHMPTDDIVLDKEQVQISDSTSTSKMNLNIESKLSLAGSILSTPVTIHKLISGPNAEKREEGRYGNRMINGRVQSGATRKSISETIPETIPEHSQESCLINMESPKKEETENKPRRMRIRPMSQELQEDERKTETKDQNTPIIIPTINVTEQIDSTSEDNEDNLLIAEAAMIDDKHCAHLEQEQGENDGDGGEDMADIIDGDW